MSHANLREFEVVTSDHVKHRLLRQNSIIACEDMETALTHVVFLRQLRESVDVGIPDAPTQIRFRTIVVGDGVVEAGCKATPPEFVVLSGTHVIFTAEPAPACEFIGWYLPADPETPVSTSPVAEIIIDHDLVTIGDIVVTAKFQLSPIHG
jgi:hypothetical protein